MSDIEWMKERYAPMGGGEHDPGEWAIHFAIDPSDADRLAEIAPTVVPGESVSVSLGDSDVDDATDAILALRLSAENLVEALEAAAAAYAKIREAAGLARVDAAPVGYIAPSWRTPTGQVNALSAEAHELHKQGRFALAVLRMHTACELAAREALVTMLRYVREDMTEPERRKLVGRKVTLTDPRTRALLQLATGKRIDESDWWRSWTEHVARRNAVAHEGLAVRYEESYGSLQAGIAFRSWLVAEQGAVMKAHGVELDIDDEDLIA